jgi:hypothetical protein
MQVGAEHNIELNREGQHVKDETGKTGKVKKKSSQTT